MDIKAILIIINTLLLIGALITLIRYVKKTAEIAKLSEESTKDIEKTTAVSREAVELSRNVLLEMQETRLLITAPLVVAYFERGEDEYASRLFFVIENVGSGVAKNIGYNFTPALMGEDTKSIKRIVMLGENIDSLPPHYRMVSLFGHIGSYLDLESEDYQELNSYLSHRFEVAVTFQDALTGKYYNENYSLDLGVPLGTCAQ